MSEPFTVLQRLFPISPVGSIHNKFEVLFNHCSSQSNIAWFSRLINVLFRRHGVYPSTERRIWLARKRLIGNQGNYE